MDGVQTGNIQRIFFEDDKQVCVLRLKNCKQNILDSACSFLAGQVAKGYDYLNALDVKLKTGVLSNEYTKICSQLVAEAYNYAGIDLVDNPSNCSPEELRKSVHLEEVKIELCNIENQPSIYQRELEQEDHTPNHYKVERRAIKLVRKLNKNELNNIYTTKDILNFLSINQSYDDSAITECFKKAGYFNDWEIIKNAFSYRYGDFDSFFTYIKSTITESGCDKFRVEQLVIENLNKLAENELKRYEQELQIARHNFNVTKQRFYHEQIALYSRLLEMNLSLQSNCKRFNELYR